MTKELARAAGVGPTGKVKLGSREFTLQPLTAWDLEQFAEVVDEFELAQTAGKRQSASIKQFTTLVWCAVRRNGMTDEQIKAAYVSGAGWAVDLDTVRMSINMSNIGGVRKEFDLFTALSSPAEDVESSPNEAASTSSSSTGATSSAKSVA